MNNVLETVVSEQPFIVRRMAKWSDCDPAGVVYAGRYNDYLLDAVMCFMRQTGYGIGSRKDQPDRVGLPCKHMALTFHTSLYPDDVVEIDVGVAEVREHTFDLIVKAHLVDGRLAFDGVFSPVCINPDTRQRVPIPDGLRKALKPHARRQEIVT